MHPAILQGSNKINIQKPSEFLYTSNKQSEKDINKTINL